MDTNNGEGMGEFVRVGTPPFTDSASPPHIIYGTIEVPRYSDFRTQLNREMDAFLGPRSNWYLRSTATNPGVRTLDPAGEVSVASWEIHYEVVILYTVPPTTPTESPTGSTSGSESGVPDPAVPKRDEDPGQGSVDPSQEGW